MPPLIPVGFEPEIVKPGQIIAFGYWKGQQRNLLLRVLEEFNLQDKFNDYVKAHPRNEGWDYDSAFMDITADLVSAKLVQLVRPAVEFIVSGDHADTFDLASPLLYDVYTNRSVIDGPSAGLIRDEM